MLICLHSHSLFFLKKEKVAVVKTPASSDKPEKLRNLLPHLVKLVLNVFRKLGAKALHPGEVFLARLAPAAKLEALVQLLLPLLQGVAEVVDPVVVRHLLAGLDRPLRHQQHLVAVHVEPQGVRLAAVVEQQKSWEYRSANLPEERELNPKMKTEEQILTYFEASRGRRCWFFLLPLSGAGCI